MSALLILGFLLGVRHALEADHVAAVAALVSRSPSLRHNVKLATLWGAGHTAALLVMASLLAMLDTALPDRVARGFEIAAGVMLVLLGTDVLRRLRGQRVHFHVHQHGDGIRHLHAHAHVADTVHDPLHHDHRHARRVLPRAALVGSVHGLAGSAALTLIALPAMHSVGRALLYITVFGLGSMLGMVAFTLAISLPLRLSAAHLTRVSYALQATLGSTTIAVGAWIAVRAAGG
jgi:sulfite exporter TauE/SafE